MPRVAMVDPGIVIAALIKGDRRALARAISIVERGGPAGEALLHALPPAATIQRTIGFTGAGGVGKSTLISALVAATRRRGLTVAVLAMDPTSTISGGTLLGDRVRMEEHHADSGVFIRSLAARRASGGISLATASAIEVVSRAGFDVIFVESIGAGQDQIDLANLVDRLVLVEAPNLGDDVQALKAGLSEHADLIAVAKADLPGADAAVAVLTAELQDRPQQTNPKWTPSPQPSPSWRGGGTPANAGCHVVAVSAYTGEGIDQLLDLLDLGGPPDVAGIGVVRHDEFSSTRLRTLVADEAASLALAALDDDTLSELRLQVSRDPKRARQLVRDWLIASRS